MKKVFLTEDDDNLAFMLIEGLEAEGFEFLPLNELMAQCDVITTHLPKNSIVIGEKEFRSKKPNSILVNTSIGLTFDKTAFLKWIKDDPTSFAIFDGPGVGEFAEEFSKYPNVIIKQGSSGFTLEAQSRLSEKVLENMLDFLKKSRRLKY